MAEEVIVARILHLGGTSHECPGSTDNSHADRVGRQAFLGEHQAHFVKKDRTVTFSQKNFQNFDKVCDLTICRFVTILTESFGVLGAVFGRAFADKIAREAIFCGTSHLGTARRYLPGQADTILGDRVSELEFLSEHNRNLQPEDVGRKPNFSYSGISSQITIKVLKKVLDLCKAPNQ